MRGRLILLMLLLSTLAAAQVSPYRHRSSLEVRTLNAPSICVGKIIRLQLEMANQNQTNCVVELEQNIRGLGFSKKYQLRINANEKKLRTWMEGGNRLLIFESNDAIDLSNPALEEYTADRKALKRPEDIIAAVRRTIRENPGVIGMQTFSYQPRTMSGEDTIFMVPLDAKLERWARRTIARSRIPLERMEAVSALGQLENPDDVPLFKRLLSDRGTVPGWRDGKRAERYGVRMAAFRALERMGVKVAPPAEFKAGSG